MSRLLTYLFLNKRTNLKKSLAWLIPYINIVFVCVNCLKVHMEAQKKIQSFALTENIGENNVGSTVT